jgi:uncharacterized membrane protein YdbT with pleckstrin-like domain
MSYVEEHLLPAESIIYRGALHWIVYATPSLLVLALLALGVLVAINFSSMWGAGIAALAIIPLVTAYITYASAEFAVTNKRVVIKVGWIQRNTVEILLSKVEAIGVDQSITGRLLNYGSITVTGTGGTDERFHRLARPLEFRRQVQAQVSAEESESRTLASSPQGGSFEGVGAREERECPYCAERILSKAKVCKHCGRDVEPIVR